MMESIRNDIKIERIYKKNMIIHNDKEDNRYSKPNV